MDDDIKVSLTTTKYAQYASTASDGSQKELQEQYTESSPHKYAKDFFKQWKKLKMLMLEFVVIDINNRPIFVLKGLWNYLYWHSLKIYKGNPSLNILEKPIQTFGTFSTHNLEEEV